MSFWRIVEEIRLEYNITFFSIEKTGRKPCSIREHIIGIVVVWERDFDVTCYGAIMCMHCKGFLET